MDAVSHPSSPYSHYSDTFSQTQARDFPEGASGSPPMDWKPGLQEEVLDAEQAEARRRGCR